MEKQKHERNCIKCSVIECLNLFDRSTESEDVGKEMYVYSLLGKKVEVNEEIGMYVCKNGRFLQSICFLTGPIYYDFKEKSYLKEILPQTTRDLKASIFLAFSGHYRQAMQVLRCCFENIISGIYFHSDLIDLMNEDDNEEEISRLEGRFNRWKEEGRQNIRATIELLRRIGFLDRSEEKNWKNLYRNLSRFIHTPEEYVCHVKHEEEELELKSKIACPASTYFSETALTEWSNNFQQVFAVLIKTITQFHPKAFETESGKLAIKLVKVELKGYEKKIPVAETVLKLLP